MRIDIKAGHVTEVKPASKFPLFLRHANNITLAGGRVIELTLVWTTASSWSRNGTHDGTWGVFRVAGFVVAYRVIG